MKPVIFLAGRYRSPEGGSDGIYENLYLMRVIYKHLSKAGFPIVCPNLSSAFIDGFITDYTEFVEGTKELLSRCDVVVFMPDWKESEGCRAEMEYAEKLNKRIVLLNSVDTFTSIEGFGRLNTIVVIQLSENIKGEN